MSKIACPRIADYHIPIYYLLEHITNTKLIKTPNITNKTIEIGSSLSPEFVCTPFKYTLGSMIEAINLGADTLIQMGGGCRYGYYSELQEKILKDLGYDVKLYNLITAGKTSIKRIYKIFKKINPKLSIIKSLYYITITIKMIKYMDKIDDFIRKNIGFEADKNSFINLKKQMLNDFSKTKSHFHLFINYQKYLKKFKKLPINKPNNCLKIGVIGELYTVMEPFSNYFIEYELAKFNIEITRFTNVNYLLFTKKRETKKALKKSQFVKNKLTADASNNIYWAECLCKQNFDGIIHIKSAFCTPEIGIIPILNKIANCYNIPIMYMSFDANTSEVGIKTRLEAFNDMIEMRRNKCI